MMLHHELIAIIFILSPLQLLYHDQNKYYDQTHNKTKNIKR